jgi:hypothetical protein
MISAYDYTKTLLTLVDGKTLKPLEMGQTIESRSLMTLQCPAPKIRCILYHISWLPNNVSTSLRYA